MRHVEAYTSNGLLSLFWHGDPDATRVVVMCGGAMGGVLGPAGAVYAELGAAFAADGIGTIRVGYRRANDLDLCTLDLVAAMDLAARAGATRFVTVGHSFGGAVAIRAACMVPDAVRGVVTLATQSAGCEVADQLDGRPLLLVHGDRDEILPVVCSESVRLLAGSGELVVFTGAGHLLVEAAAELRALLGSWIPATLGG